MGPSSPPSSVPNEVIALVVQEYVRQNGQRGLGNLLSTSTAFYYPARRLLFETLQLSLTTNRRATAELDRINCIMDLVDRFKSIRSLVKAIKLNVTGTTETRPYVAEILQGPLSSLFSLLVEFPNVQELEVSGSPDKLLFTSRGCDSDVMTSLVTIRSRPGFRHLTIRRMANVPHLLVTGVPSQDQLSTLLIQDVYLASSFEENPLFGLYDPFPPCFPPDPLGDLCKTAPFCRLERLSLDDPDYFASLFLPLTVDPKRAERHSKWLWKRGSKIPPIAFPRLKSLEIMHQPEPIYDKRLIPWILQNTPALEHLVLNTHFTFLDWRDSLKCLSPTLPRLRRLEFRTETDGEFEPPSLAHAILDHLDLRLFSQSKLEHITMQFKWLNRTPEIKQSLAFFLESFDDEVWLKRPIHLLADKFRKMTSLRSIEIVVEYRMEVSETSPGCRGTREVCEVMTDGIKRQLVDGFSPLTALARGGEVDVKFTFGALPTVCMCTVL